MTQNQKTIKALAESARGVLTMAGMKHPDGNYTLGETGHFQSLRRALAEFDKEIGVKLPAIPATP